MAIPKTEATAGLRLRFAENAIALRDRAGLSQTMAAEQADLHISHISLLERGLRLPRLDTIVKLAGAVEAEPCELLSGMTWRLAGTRKRPGSYILRPVFEVIEEAERA
jgi:transcriptional regulator with XRE-family HTH domain